MTTDRKTGVMKNHNTASRLAVYLYHGDLSFSIVYPRGHILRYIRLQNLTILVTRYTIN